MAEYSLRRLVDVGSFRILQNKLNEWLCEFHCNDADQNVARCCELVELNARIQNQLLKLLSLVSSEADPYSNKAALKARLSPLLGDSYFSPRGFLTNTRALRVVEDAARCDRIALDTQLDSFKISINNLEDDLNRKTMEAADLKADLLAAEGEIDALRNVSSTEKLFSEREIIELKHEIRTRDNEISSLKAKFGMAGHEWFDRERRQAETERDLARIRARSRSPSPICSPRYPRPISPRDTYPPFRSISPMRSSSTRTMSPVRFTDSSDLSVFAAGTSAQAVREQSLLTRYQNLYSIDRQEAMDILKRYSDDREMNEKICFAIVRESFSSAKRAFREFRSRVRSQLSRNPTGAESLETTVNEYVARNEDLGDIQSLIQDVLNTLTRDPRLSLPFSVSFTILQQYIREACRLAWQMQCLVHPIDAAYASDGELFDDLKYRRSYDSDWPSSLVSHHIWPCLIQGNRIVAKGEAVTRNSIVADNAIARARARSRSRSLGRARSLSPY